MGKLKRFLVRVLPERALGRPAAFALATFARLLGRKTGLALVYHTVGHTTGDPQRELVPPHGANLFEEQVRHVRRAYRIVPASELAAAASARRRGHKLPVAITFDDDVPSHRRLAMPILTRACATATFFLCGGSLREPFSYWWERLQAAHDRGVEVRMPVPVGAQRDIHPLAMAIEALEPPARDEVADSLLDALGPDPDDAGMHEADVRALADAGFEIGFHTLRHDALTELDDVRLEAALCDGRARLEEVVGRPITTIAYPHGKADERVAAAARRAGFETGFTTRAKAVASDDDPLLLGRLEPSFVSAGHFAVDAIRALLRRDP
jgi:peptidoglycan/xylan/chitin deacetylase (PgdA/CDA1 family)